MNEVKLINANEFSDLFNKTILDKLQNEYLGSTADDKTKAVAEFVTSDIMLTFCNLINNAPTVEEKSYAMGYQDGLEDGLDGIRPQGDLADEVWKLYKKHQSHLATHVLEFGEELADLLGKYNEGGAE